MGFGAARFNWLSAAPRVTRDLVLRDFISHGSLASNGRRDPSWTLTQFDKKKKVRALDLGAGSLRRGLGWLSDVNATGCQAQCLGLLPGQG
jgi:hypothetical protein